MPENDQEEGPRIRLTEAQEQRVAAIHAEREAHYKSVAANAQSIIESLDEGQLQAFRYTANTHHQAPNHVCL
jgi:hypothetical protein